MTMVHEVGHLLGAGRNDDGSVAGIIPKEAYSGSGNDDTPENVRLSSTVPTWSVMSSGWNPPVNDPPMDGDYIAFSIEELFTIEFDEIETMD